MPNSSNRKRTLVPGKLYRLIKSFFYNSPTLSGDKYHYMASNVLILYLGLTEFNNKNYQTFLKQDGTSVLLTDEAFERLRLIARSPVPDLLQTDKKEKVT